MADHEKKNTLTKTVWQYTEDLPEETMQLLTEIAADYTKVKNHTYQRYSGIKNINRLTPVYDIQKEMRHSGLREQLGLPSVYYELAVMEAVADIKSRWQVLKNKIGELITANEHLSADDKHYLRIVLKMDSVYAAVLNRREYEMPNKAAGLELDVKHLNNLLCRLTRKFLTMPSAEKADCFQVSPSGYSYKNGALHIVSRVPRRRIALPLKDGQTTDRQIRICIREHSAAVAIPVETKIKKHNDYSNTVFLHIGYEDMFTLSNGNIYGETLGGLVGPETERLNQKNRERNRMQAAYRQSSESGDRKKADNIEANNLGKAKYERQKKKELAKTQAFINAGINRMIATEKPEKIVITKPVAGSKRKYRSKEKNRQMTRNFRGYIRERLVFKCRLHAIELVEISSRGTGSVCSFCGAEGKRQAGRFLCDNCGLQVSIPLNNAKNIENKYQTTGNHEQIPFTGNNMSSAANKSKVHP